MGDHAAYQVCRVILTPVFRFLFRPHTAGTEKIPESGAVILAGNHIHALDPIFVDTCTKRTVRTLAKSELFEGVFRFFFRAIGAIPVYLDAPKNPQAYAEAAKALRNGEVVNISPEAARNYTDQILLPFKTGAVRLAKETGTPIVPYCIIGDYKLFSRNMKIVFADAIEIRDEDTAQANDRLYHAIEQLLLENGYEKSTSRTS